MPSFRYRTNRTKYTTGVKTINEMHTGYVEKFQKQKEELPYKKKKLKRYSKELKKLERPGKLYTIDETKRRTFLKTSIKRLKKEIRNVINNKDQFGYYSRAYNVVKKYYKDTEGDYYNQGENSDQESKGDFDNEGKVDDSDGDDSDDWSGSRSGRSGSGSSPSGDCENNSNSGSNSGNNSGSKKSKIKTKKPMISASLVELYELRKKNKKVKKKVNKRKKEKAKPKSQSIISLLKGGKQDEQDLEEENKQTLQNVYCSLIGEDNSEYKKHCDRIIRCPNCTHEMDLDQTEGMFVCSLCGVSDYVITENQVPSHNDIICEKPKYPYKKINHLIEKINQFQSKETNSIPDFIFETMEKEMKKYRVTKADISLKFVKKILRKYKYSQYYENRQYIFCKIADVEPPSLTRDQVDEIKRRFEQLEEPYMKYKPEDRSNFLNYAFILNKMFKIMGLENNARYFQLLKSGDKLKIQEKIWEKICNYLEWPYHSNKENNIKYKIKFDDLYYNGE